MVTKGITTALPKMTKGDSTTFGKVLADKGSKYGLDKPDSLRRFLATIKEETGGKGFASGENLNYSADALKKLFTAAKRNPQLADKLGRTKDHKADQEGIANLIYGGRLGNTQEGDGWRFRGMGSIQLTGRANFEKVGKLMGMTAEELASKRDDKEVQLEVAMAFWRLNGLDKDVSMDETTDKVNKHTESRATRQQTYDDLGKIFI